MREMKDSGIEWIGQIPEDWNIKRLKAVLCERNESNNPIKTDYILSLTNDRGVIPYDEKGVVGNKSKEDLSGYKLAYLNDIILNSMNVIIGSVALSKYYGCVSPVYYMLYHRNPMDDVRYYNYIFQTKEFQSKLKGYGNGIMEIRMRIQMSKLNTVELPIPDATTQTRIADFLDEKCGKIDRYIEKQQQVIEKLKAYKQSVITEAVTKGLNLDVTMKDSGIEWIGMIPEHWEVCKFGYLATVKSNLVHPNEYKSYPQVSSENIEKGSGKLLECHTVDEVGIISDNHLFFKGQILYSKIRPALNKATIAPFDGLCSADIYPIETKECLKFVLYSILSESFLEQVRTITETRVKMPKINQNELSGIWVTKIPYDEQQAIATYLDSLCESIDKAIANKEKIVRKVIEYKKSLIYEAVTGKMEV